MADYATVLRDHVTLECRSVDRIFLQAWVPKLQSVGLVCRFLLRRGFKIPSSAAFGKIGDAFVREVHAWAKAANVPVVYFGKGEDKEAIARPLIDRAAREGGDGRVVLVGIEGEGVGVALVEGQGPGAGRAPAHGVGQADGLRQPFLLLPCGIRTGARRSGRPTPTRPTPCGFG